MAIKSDEELAKLPMASLLELERLNLHQLTAKSLLRLTPRLPADWTEQRKLLGFRLSAARRPRDLPCDRSILPPGSKAASPFSTRPEPAFAPRHGISREKVNLEIALKRIPARRRSLSRGRPSQRARPRIARPHNPATSRQNPACRQKSNSCNINYLDTGWGGRIRTSAWRNQNPLPYRLATPQKPWPAKRGQAARTIERGATHRNHASDPPFLTASTKCRSQSVQFPASAWVATGEKPED